MTFLAPKSYFLPKYPPNVTTQTLITFHEKIFENFFWSHGAPLGYLGSLSQKGHPEIFSKWVLINLSNPLRHPAPLVDPLLTKNLDTAGPWCEADLKLRGRIVRMSSFLPRQRSFKVARRGWKKRSFDFFLLQDPTSVSPHPAQDQATWGAERGLHGRAGTASFRIIHPPSSTTRLVVS